MKVGFWEFVLPIWIAYLAGMLEHYSLWWMAVWPVAMILQLYVLERRMRMGEAA